MGIEYRRKMKKRAKKGDGLPHAISASMVARAEKIAARNKAKIESGQTFRGHQVSKRDSPSSCHDGLYA